MSVNVCQLCPQGPESSYVIELRVIGDTLTLDTCQDCYDEIKDPKVIIHTYENRPKGMSREAAIRNLDQSFGPHAILYPEYDDELGLRYLEGGVDPE